MLPATGDRGSSGDEGAPAVPGSRAFEAGHPGFFWEDEDAPDYDNPILELYRAQRERNLQRARPAPSPTAWRHSEPPISGRDLDAGPGPAAPALTDAERLHLEIYGYVVRERLLGADETQALREAILEAEHRYRSGEPPRQPCFVESGRPDYFRIDNVLHLGQPFFDYLTHPTMVGAAQAMIGLPVRLQQSDVHVRRGTQHAMDYEFHRGNWFGGTTANGLYHFPFVKALTNLTDLGEGDGGTAVIPGSHKLPVDADLAAVTRAARELPGLIHTVAAPAGSTLFFYESLLHSRGVIRTGRERVLIVGGYAPMMFQAASGNEPDPELLAMLPAPYRSLLDGQETYFGA